VELQRRRNWAEAVSLKEVRSSIIFSIIIIIVVVLALLGFFARGRR
jgi:Cu/Ag efflux pump CusA